jgi:hypothetical protein
MAATGGLSIEARIKTMDIYHSSLWSSSRQSHPKEKEPVGRLYVVFVSFSERDFGLSFLVSFLCHSQMLTIAFSPSHSRKQPHGNLSDFTSH